MKGPLITTTFRSGLALVLCGFVCGPANATVTFSSLGGANLGPYTGHDEGNFSMTTNAGSWLQGHIFGNPAPNILGGPIGTPLFSRLEVVENTSGLFTFSSLDLTDNYWDPSLIYSIEGTLAGSTVLFTSGSLPAASTFITVPSPDSSQVLDLLRLEIIPNSASSFNVDNIVVTTVVVPPVCDFSGDSACDLADIDDLFGQGDLLAGVSAPGSVYDLTADGRLNGDDVTAWLAEAATENGHASAYLSSDSDLDGDVDLSDFTRLTENFRPGTSGALFSTGDGDGDGDVDLGDYTRLASGFAPLGYTEAAAVPEPNSLVLFSLGGVLALSRRRAAR